MSHYRGDAVDYPAGEFWCPTCVLKTEFVVAEGHNPTDPQAPLECWKCGYTYDKVCKELEDDGITHRAVPKFSPAIPKWARQDARHALREKFRKDMERAGYRRENFTKHGVRRPE